MMFILQVFAENLFCQLIKGLKYIHKNDLKK